MTTDTARLRALLEAATPGPWMKHGRHTVTANVRRWDIDVCKTGNVADGTAEADAELIAAAVNALPGLIAENERLRARAELAERELIIAATQANERAITISAFDRGLQMERQTSKRLRAALVEWSQLADHLGLSTESHRRRTREALNGKG